MSNKKLILGIAAGVAALAVVGVICKKKGYFDNFSEKADEFGSGLKDKFAGIKESAKNKFDDLVQKGGDLADKLTHGDNANSDNAQGANAKGANGTSAGGKASGNNNNAGGNMNPATT